MDTFGARVGELINDIYTAVYPLTAQSTFDQELNYRKCTVEVLNDGVRTIWVKWGPYDCKFDELPARAMATIADNILRVHEEA